jgi:hypothetical protein
MKTTRSDTPQKKRNRSMHSHPLRTLGTNLVAGMMISGAAQGVPVYFEGTPGSTPVSMTFAHDINFMVTNASSALVYFVIDELFPAPDGDATGISFFSSQLSFSINDGAPFTISRWVDNLNSSVFNMTPGDGYFFNSAENFNLSAGDIVTLHAGTLTSSGVPEFRFNLGTNGNYTLFLADGSGNRISSDAIPEPASALMLTFGAGVAMAVHRARRTAVRR